MPFVEIFAQNGQQLVSPLVDLLALVPNITVGRLDHNSTVLGSIGELPVAVRYETMGSSHLQNEPIWPEPKFERRLPLDTCRTNWSANTWRTFKASKSILT